MGLAAVRLFSPPAIFPEAYLTLGTVAVPAGIIGNPLGAAMITFFHMATELGSSATQQVVDNLVMLREKRISILIRSNIFP